MENSTYDAAMNTLEQSGHAPDTDDPLASTRPVQEADTPIVEAESQAPEPVEDTGPASKDIDISGLPEEAQIFLRARQREMEAGMHEKFREAAQQREEAAQAMQFLEALNSDPNFAYQVLNRLQNQLSQAGYEFEDSESPDEYYGTDDFEQAAGEDPYAREIAELREWRSQMEQQWEAAAYSAQLDRQIAEIRSQHQDWDDADIQNIVDLGWSTGGDLLAASEAYQAQQDRILARYLESKRSVNTPGVLPTGQASPAPEGLNEAPDDVLRAAAMERLLNEIG